MARQLTLSSYGIVTDPIDEVKAMITSFCADNRLKIKKLDVSLDRSDSDPCSSINVSYHPWPSISFRLTFRQKDANSMIPAVAVVIQRLDRWKQTTGAIGGFNIPFNHDDYPDVIR